MEFTDANLLSLMVSVEIGSKSYGIVVIYVPSNALLHGETRLTII